MAACMRWEMHAACPALVTKQCGGAAAKPACMQERKLRNLLLMCARACALCTTQHRSSITMASRDVLTSDVLNYLVMRYLQENGFSHTAFVFGHESDVTRTAVDPNNVPPGSLITFIQKGLQYLELEANLDAGVRAARQPRTTMRDRDEGGNCAGGLYDMPHTDMAWVVPKLRRTRGAQRAAMPA
eukprot:363885-Chlamydomonas_euryale.AAC.6